jgi:hypothetical protein
MRLKKGGCSDAKPQNVDCKFTSHILIKQNFDKTDYVLRMCLFGLKPTKGWTNIHSKSICNSLTRQRCCFFQAQTFNRVDGKPWFLPLHKIVRLRPLKININNVFALTELIKSPVCYQYHVVIINFTWLFCNWNHMWSIYGLAQP